MPWEITASLEELMKAELTRLSDEYIIQDQIAIHYSAKVEKGAILKGPIIIGDNCFIASHAYLRGPIYLGNHVKIGPGCEIKQSVILNESSMAHFNYVGNSLIGSHVNLEAGAICANHYNERANKEIFVFFEQDIINTATTKFGALIGDFTKIGANAVLSPGTLLEKHQIVKRLALIEQVKEHI